MGKTLKIQARELSAGDWADSPNAIESKLRAHHAVIARRQELRAMCALAQQRSIVERAKRWLSEEI